MTSYTLQDMAYDPIKYTDVVFTLPKILFRGKNLK